MQDSHLITRPDSDALGRLCEDLRVAADRPNAADAWPGDSIAKCVRAGAMRWSTPPDGGGFGWTSEDQLAAYLELARADLTTTFVLTQYAGACRRIAGSVNDDPRQRWLPDLLSGHRFATVGISHLTTSRRHLARPILSAKAVGDDRFEINGLAPWVTGAAHADVLVIGAAMEDGREMILALPKDLPGIQPGRGVDMVALSASCTDEVGFDHVVIDPSMVIAGPMPNVMSSGSGGNAGGLQTSALAIGLAGAAVDYLREESQRREELSEVLDSLDTQWERLRRDLFAAAAGAPDCQPADVRGEANRLVMNATQAAMTAAKGAGFVSGHPVGRWCREALFFLVWSCPQPVAQAHLCELAGIQG